jgi:exopolysaccharide production protein ExoZ
LRGFAVLLVFCVHAAGNATEVLLGIEVIRESASVTWSGSVLFWLHRSHHGVYLFFVLSGYLIGRMWWPRPRLAYRSFAWRRTLRVYPAFFLSFLGSLAFAYGSGTWSPPDVPRLVGNLLFLNGWPAWHIVPFNIVTWSLFYEMTFYLAFPVVALVALQAPRWGAWLLPAAGVGVPILLALQGADLIVLCWSFLFCGVTAAIHQARLVAWLERIPGVVIVVVYLAVTTTTAVAEVPPLPALVAFGVAATLVLLKSLSPGNLVSSLLTDRPLVALGRISYSFYLVHWMVIALVARAVGTYVPTLGVVTNSALIFVGGFVLSAAVATALWWVAERPYLRWVSRAPI